MPAQDSSDTPHTSSSPGSSPCHLPTPFLASFHNCWNPKSWPGETALVSEVLWQVVSVSPCVSSLIWKTETKINASGLKLSFKAIYIYFY